MGIRCGTKVTVPFKYHKVSLKDYKEIPFKSHLIHSLLFRAVQMSYANTAADDQRHCPKCCSSQTTHAYKPVMTCHP